MGHKPSRQAQFGALVPIPGIVWALGLIVVCFLMLAWAYGLTLPAFENLDEVEHFAAVRYVAETGSLPVHDPDVQQRYLYRQEASQPPLYYILFGGLARLLSLSTEDANSYVENNPFVACGPSEHPYNKHALYHNPSRETWPWDGALLALRIQRTLSPLLQVVTIIGVFAVARLIFPSQPLVALLAAALTAFNPQFLLVASGVNNDNLVTPLAVLGVYLVLLTYQRGPALGRSLALGVLIGLAGLSKLSGFLLLGLVGMVLLVSAWRSRNWRRAVGHGLLVVGVVSAISGWWFWRNWQLYGDLTALEPMLGWVGRRETFTLPLNESGLMFRSFWGQIPCAFFGQWFYVFFGLVSLLGLMGLLVGGTDSWRDGWKDRKSWFGMLWLMLWFVLVFVGWLRWGSITAATGGRLLFPAIVSTSIFLAYGLWRLWPSVWRNWIAGALVLLLATIALTTLLTELRPLFSPPRTYVNADAPSISNPLDVAFGSTPQIGLRGYDVAVRGETPLLDVTLYWEALTPVSKDYALAVQLTSPIPGDESLRFNYNTWPGRGNYPTSAWAPGQVIADRYSFKLPPSDAVTQAWQLLVAFFETESGDRLPVRLDGQDVGAGLPVTTLRVPGRKPDCPKETLLEEPVRFGLQRLESREAMIALTGATVRRNTGTTEPALRVSLCWESLAPAPADYTVFVHLYDTNGELLATGDGPPMKGAFPTRLWKTGDRIVDAHYVAVDDSGVLTPGNYRVSVGLYDATTGERLQALQTGQPLPNNAVLLDVN